MQVGAKRPFRVASSMAQKLPITRNFNPRTGDLEPRNHDDD